MNYLEKRIIEEGKVIGDDILKVSSFLNQQVDIKLMQKIGKDIAKYFKDKNITKIVTIETSGIAPAIFVAKELNVPMVIFKKENSKTLNSDLYVTKVKSFTKNNIYNLVVSKEFICNNDSILIVDDFLAAGEAATGVIKILKMANAKVAGIGIVIEKSFQPGREKLEKENIDVYSVARIKKLSNTNIEFL